MQRKGDHMRYDSRILWPDESLLFARLIVLKDPLALAAEEKLRRGASRISMNMDPETAEQVASELRNSIVQAISWQ